MPSKAETLKEAPRYTLAKIAAIMPKIRAMPTPRMILIVRSSFGVDSDSMESKLDSSVASLAESCGVD